MRKPEVIIQQVKDLIRALRKTGYEIEYILKHVRFHITPDEFDHLMEHLEGRRTVHGDTEYFPYYFALYGLRLSMQDIEVRPER